MAIAAIPLALADAQPAALSGVAATVTTVPGMPPVVDPTNIYSEQTAGKVSPTIANDLSRVYVPHVKSNDVYVIDPATLRVVDKFKVGINPQHLLCRLLLEKQ